MGIFSRMSDIVNSNINALLDRAEDPEKMVRLMVQEMEETLVEVRTASAKSIADRKELARRRDVLHREVAEWERKASVALGRDREDLARAALLEKRHAQEACEHVDAEFAQLEETIENLSRDIAMLQEKIRDAKARQQLLVRRGTTAQTRLGVRKQLDRSNVDDALQRFERAERRMDELEGEVESYDLGQKTLADEIADLEADEQIDAELAELRAKLSGSGTTPTDTGSRTAGDAE